MSFSTCFLRLHSAIPRTLTLWRYASPVIRSRTPTLDLHRAYGSGNKVSLSFCTTSGKKYEAKANLGDNLLDVIIDNDIDFDGFGACEGTLACSTCHLIFTKEQYAAIGSEPNDEELDMLDLAFGLTDTSRLGCQVIVKQEMDGWEIQCPEGLADARDV